MKEEEFVDAFLMNLGLERVRVGDLALLSLINIIF